MDIADGTIVLFECRGAIPGSRWLDGRTGDGTVGLAPMPGAGFTGTLWRVHVPDEGDGIGLECCGHIPGNRWLQAFIDGSIGLAPQYVGYTGTRWRIEDYGAGLVELHCMGDFEDPDEPSGFLDGLTQSAAVRLAGDESSSGSRWAMTVVGDSNSAFYTLEITKNGQPSQEGGVQITNQSGSASAVAAGTVVLSFPAGATVEVAPIDDSRAAEVTIWKNSPESAPVQTGQVALSTGDDLPGSSHYALLSSGQVSVVGGRSPEPSAADVTMDVKPRLRDDGR
jgi:hypothetical protein